MLDIAYYYCLSHNESDMRISWSKQRVWHRCVHAQDSKVVQELSDVEDAESEDKLEPHFPVRGAKGERTAGKCKQLIDDNGLSTYPYCFT